ncbi:MAG: CoA transferase [Candidatus Binatus sp.]|uniref:CaiB/BaiF CoA transferase family protein n=1 Tax=Candidatus Binatus sp. TaxID=2811406 RepID=UPI00271A88D6|nr:CoA transferase [Candidatus Binatus sp.]MDO8432990.1 CoA transferase [Candidatus Binatus sp.]
MERPLEGVKVVEVAMWVAGPSTTAVLGDWGADVVKLEDPKTGDPIRGFVTRTMGDPNARIRPPFELDNRNKRSVAVDLRRPEGHAFALRLIERADVFLTSLRLDALERMKLDYPTLSARNPRLIYASINGYGHRGPDRNRPAYDYAAAWARSGLMATIAEPGQPPPAQRPAMIDHAVGLGLAGAISAALLGRERSGRGREVMISLYSMGLWMNASDLTVGLMTGRSPRSEARTERVNPIWSSYRCADDRWIYFVMVQSDRFWADFCRALDQPRWFDDARFKDSSARAENCAALTAEIDRVVATKTWDEWAPIFDAHHLIWAPVRTDAEVLDDPQAHAIGAFAQVEHPQIPGCRVVNSPIEFGGAEPRAHRGAPELGQHTEEVALEAGLSWDEIARLKESGALG